jgi:hypothetical protein
MALWRLSEHVFAPILPQLRDVVAGFPWDLTCPIPARTDDDIAGRLSEDALRKIIETHRDLHHAVDKRNVALQPSRVQPVSEAVRAHLTALGITRKSALSGAMAYPPGGWMGWHTNSDQAGWRLYITFVEHGGRSFFRWWDGGLHTDPDTPGFNFRVFEVFRNDAPFWHCVHAAEWRLSIGHRFHEADRDAVASAAGAGPR